MKEYVLQNQKRKTFWIILDHFSEFSNTVYHKMCIPLGKFNFIEEKEALHQHQERKTYCIQKSILTWKMCSKSFTKRFKNIEQFQRKQYTYTLFRNKGFLVNLNAKRNASKFAMFMEKANPRSFFHFSFRATFIFPLWMPWSMST